jgi:SAM-dependent methyltransferase
MADSATLRARSLEFWTLTAPGWVRHADTQDELNRPLGQPAMDWLRLAPGEVVLDVGCGCGGTTAELVRAVGASGRAVGVDVAEPMVEAARSRFGSAGLPLEFLAADVETLETLPGAPYDAVFSRMVLMLLPDPVAGLTTIRRSMRPGGRLAATVFRDGATNPWLPAAMLGAAPHLGALPPLPTGDEPGPFAFADPERPRRLLTDAGFTDVQLTAYDVAMRAGTDGEALAELLIEVGPASAAYRAADPEARTAARAGAARLLERFREPDGSYALPSGFWLITAVAPPTARPAGR